MEKKFDLLCSLSEGEEKVDEMLLKIRTDDFDLGGTLDLFASADHETLWKGLFELSRKGIEKVCSESSILNELFVFDFFENKKMNILKVGYRFKFQSDEKSLTDKAVDKVMDKIIKISMSTDGIKIEGL